MNRSFTIGQVVGILTGMLAVDGPAITRYGTVVRVVSYWGRDEYVVRELDGTEKVFAHYLLSDDVTGAGDWFAAQAGRAASMMAHPAGKGRPVKIEAAARLAPGKCPHCGTGTLEDFYCSPCLGFVLASFDEGNENVEYIGADGRTYVPGVCDVDSENTLVTRHSLGANGATFLCGTHSHFA